MFTPAASRFLNVVFVAIIAVTGTLVADVLLYAENNPSLAPSRVMTQIQLAVNKRVATEVAYQLARRDLRRP